MGEHRIGRGPEVVRFIAGSVYGPYGIDNYPKPTDQEVRDFLRYLDALDGSETKNEEESSD